MKKYLPVLFLVVFLVPSIALASWWNPFTWKIFKKRAPAPQVQVVSIEKEKTPEEKIVELQKQLDELKTKKIEDKIIEKVPVIQKEVKRTATSKNTEQNKLSEQARVEAELKTKIIEQSELAKKQAEEERIKQEQIDRQKQIDEITRQLTILNNSTQIIAQNTTPSPEPVVVSKKDLLITHESINQHLRLDGGTFARFSVKVLNDLGKEDFVSKIIIKAPNKTETQGGRLISYLPVTTGDIVLNFSIAELGLSKDVTINVKPFTRTLPTATFDVLSGKDSNGLDKIGKLDITVRDFTTNISKINYKIISPNFETGDIRLIWEPMFFVGSGGVSTTGLWQPMSLSLVPYVDGPVTKSIYIKSENKSQKTGSYMIQIDNVELNDGETIIIPLFATSQSITVD